MRYLQCAIFINNINIDLYCQNVMRLLNRINHSNNLRALRERLCKKYNNIQQLALGDDCIETF